MKNLIGISGKIGSGKDTVGKIIQYLVCMADPDMLAPHQKDFDYFRDAPIMNESQSRWKIKKFADALKDCVCVILGCTREQLESHDFKDKPLGSEWELWQHIDNDPESFEVTLFNTEKEAWDYDKNSLSYEPKVIKKELTPRLLLQLLGTEAGRRIIHPNIWVNASFARYIPQPKLRDYESKTFAISGYRCKCNTCNETFNSENKRAFICGSCVSKQKDIYPNWIFTDMRFPNELESIKSRGGITIRVQRPCKHCGAYNNIACNHCGSLSVRNVHESETALDSAKFDYIIDNDGSIESLIQEVKSILQREGII